MSPLEARLLALILAGLGGTAAVASSVVPSSPEAASLGGTMHLGLAPLALQACGDKDDDDDTGEEDTGEEDTDTDGGETYGGDAGRPFTLADGPRVAAPVPRADWLDPAHVHVSGLDAADRAALATHFLRMARAEHASVASFHRVALELLHLGAPPELLRDTGLAALDEIRHARVAFGLAARFGEGATGPGALDVADALSIDLSPAGVMRRLVDEACVGETVSALVLRHAAASCEDTALAAILADIAEDEERHAALGWRTLRWLLERHPALREEALARIAGAAPGTAVPEDAAAPLSRWGCLDGTTRRAIRSRAFAAIIAPAAAALA